MNGRGPSPGQSTSTPHIDAIERSLGCPRPGLVIIARHRRGTLTPTLLPPPCACCGQTAELVPKLTRFRRGDRVLPFDGWLWRCANGCADPDTGEASYEFSTPTLMVWEEERAAEAWLLRFGEPMPPSKRAQQVAKRRRVVDVSEDPHPRSPR